MHIFFAFFSNFWLLLQLLCGIIVPQAGVTSLQATLEQYLPVIVTNQWCDYWKLASALNDFLVDNPTTLQLVFDLLPMPMSPLNHFCTAQGHCAVSQAYYTWKSKQTVTLSVTVHKPSSTGACASLLCLCIFALYYLAAYVLCYCNMVGWTW